ncbi:MAG: hypothetical protein KH846_02635 [Leptotrichia wadei]|jgi:hypothetical protein|uniref:hypothetical protein n=1 Tax=Leptotrichia wadei TaxID=157687 RepID=UPI0026F275F4|nr:hypothetical protein [Leptotrichia wadei]MBS6019087.1 hypothetical protein [Leptotrichia wadei]
MQTLPLMFIRDFLKSLSAASDDNKLTYNGPSIDLEVLNILESYEFIKILHHEPNVSLVEPVFEPYSLYFIEITNKGIEYLKSGKL